MNAEVQELAIRYGEAWVAHDLDAIMAMHTEDTVFHLHGGSEAATGRAAVREPFAIAYEGFDPCAVILVANWGDKEQEREQQFFAHAECFRKSGSGTDLYILDPDFDQQ
jgi:hypothetical protein